mmetsp:Transcript_17839/g.60844  ORF Transcript_17839/g.60844 Transcript_17839/m.60844 type:complete len:159 (-) Transcript_17839:356-832(-)
MGSELYASCEPTLPYDILAIVWGKCSAIEKIKMSTLSRQMKRTIEPNLQHALALVNFICGHQDVGHQDVAGKKYNIIVQCACSRDNFQLTFHHICGDTFIRELCCCQTATFLCTAQHRLQLATILARYLLKKDIILKSWRTTNDFARHKTSCDALFVL